MAQTQCLRIPLEPKEADAFVSWLRSLASRPEELRAALTAEGMLAELVFLERSGDSQAIVLYTRAVDLAQAHQTFSTSEHAIDREMRDFQARALRLGEATQLEVLLEHGVPAG